VRTIEDRVAFLSKRAEFRKLIRSFANAQQASKVNFRQAKAETHPIHRSEILNPLRTGLAYARNQIRYLLLAYALFRGKPYAVVEQKAATPVRAYNIWEALRRVGLEEKYTKAGIELWLSGRIPDLQIDIAADGSVSTKYTDAKIPESVFGASA